MINNKIKTKQIIQFGSGLILSVFLVFFGHTFIARAEGAAVSPTYVETFDLNNQLQLQLLQKSNEAAWWKDFTWQKALDALSTAGSKALGVAIRNSLNKIAYDTATWIGSGGEGQQPLFIREDWGTYLSNIADEAAGEFIEGLSSDWPIDLCQPGNPLKLSIGLGLVQYQRPGAPRCTFSQMQANWDASLSDPNFLVNFQDMFNPTSNDLGIALSIYTRQTEEQIKLMNLKTKEREESGGWLDLRNIAGNLLGVPGEAKRELTFNDLTNAAAFGQFTGDALVDAANVFLNQLAITLFNTMMRNLADGKDTYTHTYFGNYGLGDYNAAPGQGNLASTKEYLRQLTNPSFRIRGDYNILAELTLCPNPTKAGPTNCVITDNFRQAVSENETVGSAMDKGYLNPNAVFGFSANGLEPNYNEGYPYRSMIILRKFRILPNGWEVASEYIKNHQEVGTRSLKDLVSCFATGDNYDSYYADWCLGLVDPSWVLKAPLNFCKREGPGPEITGDTVSGQGSDSKRQITRDTNYCADEQSCIKENSDGSCALYGYCTEEKRGWNFNTSVCSPLYNTCETFVGNGKTLSVLKNTLNQTCNSGDVGCRAYSTTAANYDSQKDIITWTGADKYFNGKAQNCSSGDEGCHQFTRIKNDGTKETIYEKIIPPYLENVCYVDNSNFSLKADAPAICSAKFSRKCGGNEVGCKMYTRVEDGMKLPGIIGDNQCSIECVGYEDYIQKETVFENQNKFIFVPITGQTCSAEVVGCDEFTNLDKVASGGEAREYYTDLRQCVKPSSSGSNCSNFYSWEQKTGGPQLMLYVLKAKNFGQVGEEPAVTESDGDLCNAAIFALPPGAPGYNPDCREFVSKKEGGAKSYHLYSKTISCSENCHPYRRTELNINPNIAQDACVGSDRNWQNGECTVCKGGGVWDASHQACVYSAITEESRVCSATSVGCREYGGSFGANIRVVFTHNFDDKNLKNWNASNLPTIRQESIATGGSSLYVAQGEVFNVVGTTVNKGESYILQILARAEQDAGRIDQEAVVTARLSNGTVSKVFSAEATVGNNWQLYTLNLNTLDHTPSADEKLILTVNERSVYLDYIRLIVSSDNYFLIKKTWSSGTCSNQAGCAEYRDDENKTVYFSHFAKVCQESSVGCEVMEDAQNGSPTKGEAINVVYNKNKLCNQTNNSCLRYGAQNINQDDVVSFQDVYLKPYASSTVSTECANGSSGVGCQVWTSNSGTSYFKDPGDQICEWRTAYQGGENWYKKKVNRCDGVGAVCSKNSDCNTDKNCKLETSDTPCPMNNNDNIKTLGYGGAPTLIKQPVNGWVGLCPAEESSCTEYIDPLSKFNNNLVFNPDFSDIDKNGVAGDGWNGVAQAVKLETNALYRLSGDDASLSDCPNLYLLGRDNKLRSGSVVVSAGQGIIFYSGANIRCNVNGGALGKTIKLQKLSVDYRLAKDLNKKLCNGVANNADGCVLFNERVSNGQDFSGLTYDAATTGDGSIVACGAYNGVCDSNALIKVEPDRACNSWLACKSRVELTDDTGNKNNICLNIGLCNSVDGNGNCNNFISEDQVNQSYKNSVTGEKINNLSGYIKVGYEDNSLTSLYPFGAMSQVGEVSMLPNGNFENAGNNGYPIGWYTSGGSWSENYFKVIKDPITAQGEGIKYNNIDGRNFLRVGSTGSSTSEFVDVEPNTNYTLTAKMNTLNLQTGEARVNITQYTVSSGSTGVASEIVLGHGFDWMDKLLSFKTASDAYKIKIRLYASDNDTSDPLGKFYYDNIQIRPALEVHLNTALSPSATSTVPQTCRLYPNSDSLSCNYVDDSGKQRKGWRGYCLEYDRYPGSQDACLLWWPVESVNGDGIEESGGYSDKYPLYYCTNAVGYCNADGGPQWYCHDLVQVVSPAGQNKYWASRVYSGSGYEVPFANTLQPGAINWSTSNIEPIILNYTRNSKPFGSINPPAPLDNPYEWDAISEANTNVQPLTVLSQVQANSNQTTVNAGTPYYGDDNICGKTFSSQSTPHGGSTSTAIPGEWSKCVVSYCGSGCGTASCSMSQSGLSWTLNVRVGIRSGCSAGGGGQAYCTNTYHYDIVPVDNTKSLDDQRIEGKQKAVEGIKRLFAQSYGSWTWNGNETNGRYILSPGNDWGPPQNACSGNARPNYIVGSNQDLCAVPPVVGNILVNNSNTNVVVSGTQFVNLTFTSDIDSQQLPLVMYAVDWGDNDKTVVSGVEMRDRSNPANPNSLYHLYSYWDLKKKNVAGNANIQCANDGATMPNGFTCPANTLCCAVQPKIQVKDNWGWCNGGATINDCTHWSSFGSWVVVEESR